MLSPLLCFALLFGQTSGTDAAPATAATVGHGAVASSQEDATEVGLAILQAGGNAVDAAVAVHFALAVTYPYAGNLGGGGFFLLREAGGQSWFLDFREVAPAAATADMYLDAHGQPIASASRLGWKAVGVPGAVPGMWEAHRRWGRLPWKELIQPSIALAQDGFLLDEAEAGRILRYGAPMREDPLAATLFFDEEGAPLQAGAILRQPELARTLRRIAEEGVEALRSGPIVEELVARSASGGGVLRAEDFRDYAPALRPVMSFEWRGHEVLAASPPSSGGVFLQQVLGSLEGLPLRLWGFDDARTVHLLAEATAAAFRDRNRWLGDPAGRDFDLQQLLDPDYLDARRRAFSWGRVTRPDREMPQPFPESAETTHFSVVDGSGAAVSCTTTLNGAFGAKVMAPGGFLMNNEMDDFAARPGHANQFGLVQGSYNAIEPGRRPLSSMSPVIVVKQGAVDAVLGSPGGPTILTSVLQVLMNRYQFHMTPQSSVRAARFHRQDQPPVMRFEARRLDGASREDLVGRGHSLLRVRALGDVNAIFRWRGQWEAVADPRHSGAAGVVANPLPAE